MKIEIKDYCIRCGICVGLYPELFAHNFDKDCIDVLQNPETEELETIAKNAAADCAVTAIFLHK
jgi:ferredoxin